MRYTGFFPCSLFPVPCSLFPVPCSLLPAPCSLFQQLILLLSDYLSRNIALTVIKISPSLFFPLPSAPQPQ
ncbi:hypothetical protein [Moorena sp. SIO3H5]|uniref:hypothetical protein n=1 Tax=Moorena sp. SIO3H5 TaxID=2607834 RepID=UPI0013B9A1E8|nr:hypothetical protein [Moorena sp. SIO3H5]NEO72271.1 hypothetical protein [Moorena sp. SIO3H5]